MKQIDINGLKYELDEATNTLIYDAGEYLIKIELDDFMERVNTNGIEHTIAELAKIIEEGEEKIKLKRLLTELNINQ